MLRKIGIVIGNLLALPATIVGCFVFLLYGVKRITIRDGAIRFVVKKIKIGYEATRGQTIGAAVAIEEGHTANQDLWEHELCHTRQFMTYTGVLFPIVYGLSSLNAFLMGFHWYYDNAFEHQARAAAHHVYEDV